MADKEPWNGYFYDYTPIKRPPKVSMYDPIPKEMLRNLPPWVGKLQTVSYLLMLPFALVLVWVLWLWPLGESIGLWHFPIAPVAAGSAAGSSQHLAQPRAAKAD